MSLFIVTFDLSDNDVSTIRARLADDEIEVHRESADVWHLYKNRNDAHVRRLGSLGNGDTVFLFDMPAGARSYLENKLGASKVVRLAVAWADATPRAALGGITAKQWLLSRGFGQTTGSEFDGIPAGEPVSPGCPSGYNPIIYGQL